MSTNTTNLFDSPIAATVDGLQNVGRDVYIAGFTAEGDYALVVDVDNDRVTMAPIGTVSGLGRWECTTAHRQTYADLYAERFPRLT